MIKNYINIIGMNENYWVLSTQNKSSLDLLSKYFKEIYEIIESLDS
jgi:hypothetical protein